jgi:hypothetical protein
MLAYRTAQTGCFPNNVAIAGAPTRLVCTQNTTFGPATWGTPAPLLCVPTNQVRPPFSNEQRMAAPYLERW